MDLSNLPSLPQPFLSVPYDQRWELLKTTIKQFYIEEHKPVPEIARILEGHYGFSAA